MRFEVHNPTILILCAVWIIHFNEGVLSFSLIPSALLGTRNIKVDFYQQIKEKNRIWNKKNTTPLYSSSSSSEPLSKKQKSKSPSRRYNLGVGKNAPLNNKIPVGPFAKAVDRNHLKKESAHRFDVKHQNSSEHENKAQQQQQHETLLTYDQIDLSIPLHVYNPEKNIDLVWDLMRSEARIEAEREPLLVSYLYSSILNHPTLESALACHLANRLSSPAMISTQLQSLIMEALTTDSDENGSSLIFRKSVRADMLAVRDRDPACTCLPYVFLYFKGFHALQTYRVSHYLYKSHRRVLAHHLQSQVSQILQIDIHPNATLGSGMMLDHGTGIVIGETAAVGHNCSILHHVTLGGSGKKGVDRHPKIGNGVLIGAGATVLGNIRIGNGVQIGAGTLVIEDLPDHSVAIGVPQRIIGTFVDNTAQPSMKMNQTLVGSETDSEFIRFGGSGI